MGQTRHKNAVNQAVLALLNLVQEMEEVCDHLERVGVQLDRGLITSAEYDLAVTHLRDCQAMFEDTLKVCKVSGLLK